MELHFKYDQSRLLSHDIEQKYQKIQSKSLSFIEKSIFFFKNRSGLQCNRILTTNCQVIFEFS